MTRCWENPSPICVNAVAESRQQGAGVMLAARETNEDSLVHFFGTVLSKRRGQVDGEERSRRSEVGNGKP